jgi:hypothetical protein
MPRSNRTVSIIGLLSLVALVASLIACTGPEARGTVDPTFTPTVTPTPTEVAPTPTLEPTPTVEPTASPTPEPSPTVEPTPSPTANATPTEAATPDPNATPTLIPTPADIADDITAWLATLPEMPGSGYVPAEEGSRTAQELANAYSDPVAHLQRLEDWGFQQHVFRAFSRTPAQGDPLPYYVLSTINEYGSSEQADAALQWLRASQTTLGATIQDAPEVGEDRIALTVNTREGIPTASLYVRAGPHVFIYFAEGGDPLAAVRAVAERVFARDPQPQTT